MKKTPSRLTIAGYLLASLLLFSILLFFQFKGITYNDEGYILNSALRVAHGQIPYKDFDMVYTPLSFLTTAAFLKIFGESLFAGRLLALTVSILSLFALFKLSKIFSNNPLLIFLCLLFFTAWGPSHINFPWPIIFSACLLLYSALLYFQGFIQKNPFYFFLAGLTSTLLFLAKQNFGATTILTLLLCFSFLDRNKRLQYLKYFLLGIIPLSLLFLILLLSTSSLEPFIHNMYFYTLKRIVINKALDTPFLYQGSLLSKSTKLLFYLSPLIISLFAAFLARKDKNKIFILGLLSAVFYLSGIRPTTDYVHLVYLLAISAICLLIIFQFSKNPYLKFLTVLYLSSMTLFGFYNAYFNGYYKWEDPLTRQTSFAENKRIRLFLSPAITHQSNELIKYIDDHTTPRQPIFVNYYAPMIYFLSNRNNATSYDLTFDLELSDQQKIIQELKNKKVPLVIIHRSHINDKDPITKYIKPNFHLSKTIGNYLIFINSKPKSPL